MRSRANGEMAETRMVQVPSDSVRTEVCRTRCTNLQLKATLPGGKRQIADIRISVTVQP